jgi:hypothetical protein
MPRQRQSLPFAALVLSSCALARAEPEPAPTSVSSRETPLAVREVTVFKDGHAYVLREGRIAPDGGGRVVIEDLPEPVLGTFWPYASGGGKVVSATAARERVVERKTALDLRQLLEANAGAEVAIVDQANNRYEGRLLGFPRRGADEVERLDPSGGRPRVAESGSIVRLATDKGTLLLPLERIRDVQIAGDLGESFEEEALRNRLTLRLDGAGPGTTVGVAYVQKGLRWIPSYKVDLDGEGRARVEMEATLVNDLVDLENASVNLVIGAPRFEFAGMTDPIALQSLAARVASRMPEQNAFSNMLSNTLMTQAEGYDAGEARPEPASPELAGGESNEDLYVFTLRGVTLRKGERLVLPVTSFDLSYHDVYVLDVAFGPPAEFEGAIQSDRAERLATLLSAPKAMHAIRLTNSSTAPLTTAPALVLSKGRVLAQGLLKYTPVGARTDLSINPAVDVCVEVEERETGRTPNAMSWSGSSYGRIDLAGEIELRNEKREAVELEVRRSVLGLVDEVGEGGSMEQESLASVWGSRPEWWGWFSWPYWWYRWNGYGRFSWSVRLEPGQTTILSGKWHYFWR